VRVFRHRTQDHSDLARQLRSDRPRPSRELVDQLVAEAPSRPSPQRNLVAGRLALASLLTLILLAALAATGGVGQVASGGKVAAERVKSVVGAPFGQSKNTESTSTNAATPNGGSLNTLAAPADPPGQDQYKPGCGRGDPNEPHTGPPGNNNGFPGRCPPSAPPPVTPLP
jgi:hypothetical protein